MKKRFICIFSAVCILFSPCIPVSAEMRIKILYGKSEVVCDVAPVIVNDRTMVPVRAIFEAIGASVSYEESTRKITATKADKTVVLHVDSNIMRVNDDIVTLDSAPFIKEDRTLVPIRACAESFNLDVEWFGEARIVKIKKGAWFLTEKTDSNGVKETNTYDERGNLIEKAWVGGQVNTYTYDDLDNCLSLSVSGGGGWWDTYDVYGNLILHKQPFGSETLYTYDDDRRIITESVKSRYSPYPTVYHYTYNDAGKLIRKETADGSIWEAWTHDDQNRLLRRDSSGGIWSSNTYDENGNLIASEDHYGMWNRYEYDERGNRILETNNQNRTIKNFYDENDRLIRWEDNDGFWRTYSYDEAGRKIQEQSEGNTITYSYDVHGNLVRQENSDGYYTVYTYKYYLQ